MRDAALSTLLSLELEREGVRGAKVAAFETSLKTSLAGGEVESEDPCRTSNARYHSAPARQSPPSRIGFVALFGDAEHRASTSSS